MLEYGMGTSLTAENMHVSKEEAEKITEDFFQSFPKMKEFLDTNERLAQELGYVEDAWGRRRRLPDAMLPDYEFSINDFKNDFNPLFDSVGDVYIDKSKDFNNYLTKLRNAKSSKERTAIKEDAKKNNIKIRDNGAFISRAARQSTNAKIQGSAATMTKKAMIDIYNDKEINDLGFKLLIGVHDELIGECPTENAEKCGKRLSYLMTHAALDKVTEVPFKCDAEIEESWYLNSYAHQLQKDYADLKENGLSDDEAFSKICKEHEEFPAEKLHEILLMKD